MTHPEQTQNFWNLSFKTGYTRPITIPLAKDTRFLQTKYYGTKKCEIIFGTIPVNCQKYESIDP